MRVLVAGGAGYVGSTSVEALVAARQGVVVYDNLSTGHASVDLAGGVERQQVGLPQIGDVDEVADA